MRKIDASYRLMKIFKMLHEKGRSIDDIVDALCSEDIYINKEIVGKYFKTLRKFGCVIEKQFGKFELLSIPFSLNLEKEDFKHLALLDSIANYVYGEDVCSYLKKALNKILSLVQGGKSVEEYGKHLNEVFGTNKMSKLFHDKISKLVKLGYGNSKIQIVYKGTKINISNISFKYYDNAVFVHVFNEDIKNYELILLEDIEEIAPMPNSSFASVFAPSTVFKIYGRLVKSYNLYEGERVVGVEDDALLISNNFEDKDQLLKRLIHYKEYCKIVSPESDIIKFKQLLDQMYKNLTKIG